MELTITALPLPVAATRLLIRQLQPADEHNFLAIYQDPEVMRFLDPLVKITPAVRWRQVLSSPTMFTQQLAVTQLDSNLLIGLCGLIDRPGNQFERWVLLRPMFWRQGYGTEVSSKLTEVAFNHLNARLVFGIIDPANAASLAMVQRLGYSYFGEYFNKTKPEHWQNGHHKYGLERPSIDASPIGK